MNRLSLFCRRQEVHSHVPRAVTESSLPRDADLQRAGIVGIGRGDHAKLRVHGHRHIAPLAAGEHHLAGVERLCEDAQQVLGDDVYFVEQQLLAGEHGIHGRTEHRGRTVRLAAGLGNNLHRLVEIAERGIAAERNLNTRFICQVAEGLGQGSFATAGRPGKQNRRVGRLR